MRASAAGAKAVNAARGTVQQTAMQTQEMSRPATMAVVSCLSATLVIVWLASGCGLAPCGEHGNCDGIFSATCICNGGYYGDACQYSARYVVEGCVVRSHCGTFNETNLRCDGAPVYQSGANGPVLYRHTGRATNWAVGPARRKVDCAAIPALSSFTTSNSELVVYARSYWHDSGTAVDATGEPPSSPLFEGSFGGWRDFGAPHGSQLGTVKVRDG